MKIAIVHLTLTTESGDPRMVASLAQAYKSLGHNVVIYTAEFNNTCFPDILAGFNIRVILSPVPLSSLTGASRLLSKIVERIRRFKVYKHIIKKITAALEKDIDLLHCQNDDSYKIGLLYKRKNPHVKVVWIMHNPPFFHSTKSNLILDILSKISAYIEKKAAKHFSQGVDKVITYDREKEMTAIHLGLPVKIMGIPVDFEKFYVPRRKALNLKQEIVILSIGALSPYRCFEDTILATAILRHQNYPARAVIICKDYWRDGKYREQFEKFVINSGVKNFIHTHFKGVSEKELVKIFKESDVFVFPNNIKIWGMAAFEAMAAGLPLLVSNITSVADVLNNGVNALFVEPNKPKQIALGIKHLIDNPEIYKLIVENGQKFVRHNLNWEKYASEIINFSGVLGLKK